MESPPPTPVSTAIDPTAPIVCRVTNWYFRRMAMGGGVLLVFGCLFLYDGIWGYPKSIALARKKEWFEKEFLATFDQAKAQGRLDQWIAEAKAQNMPTGTDGEPPRWVSYAAQNGWEESPKLFTDAEVAEQFWFGYGCLAGAVIVGIITFLNKDKTLRAEADHWITPEGGRISFSEVFRVDKRKWQHKGLAYAWHRAGGAEKRAVIDDLKFGGADKVLDRILSRFSGELIEKTDSPPPAQEESAPASE